MQDNIKNTLIDLGFKDLKGKFVCTTKNGVVSISETERGLRGEFKQLKPFSHDLTFFDKSSCRGNDIATNELYFWINYYCLNQLGITNSGAAGYINNP